MVLKHYLRPGQGDFRTAIFKAMPKMLADSGHRSVKDETSQITEHITPRKFAPRATWVLSLASGGGAA